MMMLLHYSRLQFKLYIFALNPLDKLAWSDHIVLIEYLQFLSVSSSHIHGLFVINHPLYIRMQSHLYHVYVFILCYKVINVRVIKKASIFEIVQFVKYVR